MPSGIIGGMKRRSIAILLPVLGMVLLFVLVGLSKQPGWGPVRTGSGQHSQPVQTNALMDSGVMRSKWGPDPRIDLPLSVFKPTEPWSCGLMRLEKAMWRLMKSEAPVPEALTLGQLADAMNRGGWCSLELEDHLLRDIPMVAPGAQDTFADVLRATADSAGLSVVPSEYGRIFYLTRSLQPAEWPRAWPRVRILKRLRGEAPDAVERAWQALDRPAPAVPENPADLAAVTDWLATATTLAVELSEDAVRAIEPGLRLQFPRPEEGDTIASVSRVALAGAGLDVASRHGAILICTRGEADALSVRRRITAPWTDADWEEGLRLQAYFDRTRVPLQGRKYVPATLIINIADACKGSWGNKDVPYLAVAPPALADDVTSDDPTLIALPEGDYTVRELREMLWTCAGVRMHVLKNELWFVSPENP